MTRNIPSLVVLLAVASLSPGRAQTNTPPTAPVGDDVVAKGKGLEIRRSQLDQAVSSAKAQAALDGRTVKPEQTTSMKRQILEQLINVRLLEGKATEADKAAGKAAAEQRYLAVRTRLGSEDAFNRQLKSIGATREEVMSRWTEALTGEAVLKREFKINITDADMRKYYEDNPSEFDAPETIRASHILLATLDLQTGARLPEEQQEAKHKQAEALLKRARAGEDFALLATEFSDDPVSKAKGGEYTFSRGKMVPEFEAAALALNTNQISGVVTSSYGYHIIKLSEKIPAHKRTFANAISDIRDVLIYQTIQQQFPGYIARLRSEAGVEILDETLKPKQTSGTGAFVSPSPRVPPKKPEAK